MSSVNGQQWNFGYFFINFFIKIHNKSKKILYIQNNFHSWNHWINYVYKKKLINFKNITIDSKSGYSGAGKNYKSKFKFKNFYLSTYAYSVKNHRHIAEIDQEFKKISKNIIYTFNPHLIPSFRGILSSIYVNKKKDISLGKIVSTLKSYYKNSYFIKIYKPNTQIGTGNVIKTNFCDISVCQTRLDNKIVIFSAIDNLIKGAAGQAIQNMNLLYNLNETTGLKWNILSF